MKLIFVMVVITVLELTQGKIVLSRNRGAVCPSGWYRILDSCIWLSREKKNFAEAGHHCNQFPQSRLFEPKSRLQNDLVVTLVEMRQKEDQYAWIGITDLLTEGTFTYLSSGKEVFFTKWTTGEPNNFYEDEDCVNFLFKDRSWNDFGCSNKLHFICEIPLNDLLLRLVDNKNVL